MEKNNFGERCNAEVVLQHLIDNMNEVRKAFPEPFFRHRYAVKANPIKSVLRVVKENGFGCECASYGEVYNALQSGMEMSDVGLSFSL